MGERDGLRPVHGLEPFSAEQIALARQGRRFPGCHSEALGATFRSAGLIAVETRPIQIAMSFPRFDDYWRPFLGGPLQGTSPRSTTAALAGSGTGWNAS